MVFACFSQGLILFVSSQLMSHACSCNNLISGLEAFHLFDATKFQSMFSKAMIVKNDIKSKICVMFENPTASHI